MRTTWKLHLIVAAFVNLQSSCIGSNMSPRTSPIGIEEWLRSETVVVGVVKSVAEKQRVAFEGREFWLYEITVEEVVYLRALPGQGDSKLLRFEVFYSMEGQPPGLGERRLFFLRTESGRFRAVRDSGAFSLLIARADASLTPRHDPTLANSIAELLLSPGVGDPVQPNFPDVIGTHYEWVVAPMLGRHEALRLLERLLQHNDLRVRTRACETIIYSTAVPHRCLERVGQEGADGIADDLRLRGALKVLHGSFISANRPGAARKWILEKCMLQPPVAFVATINREEDCLAFAELALLSVVEKWRTKPER